MHLNSAGTSSVLRLPVAEHLIDVFQLKVETQEDELILGSEFEELVPAVVASNSNTTSRQDFGVVSVSSI